MTMVIRCDDKLILQLKLNGLFIFVVIIFIKFDHGPSYQMKIIKT